MTKTTTRPRKRPRQARARVTVELLVEAAGRVLDREGLDRLTTRRVAAVAGVSVGSLYQYFPSKESILAALVERYFHELYSAFTALLDAATQAPLPMVVDLMLRGLLEVFRGQRPIQRAIYESLPTLGLTHVLLRILDRYVDALERFLRARTDVHAPDARVAAFVVVHAMEGLIRRFSTSLLAGFDEELHLAEVARLLVAYLSRPSRITTDQPP